MHPDLIRGKQLPNLQLPDHSSITRTLTELAAGDPLVVQFFRGWFCPKEQRYARQLVELQTEAEVAYSRFVSISVDPPEQLAAFRAGLDARWTFLSDAARTYLHDLDLLEKTDTVHHPYVPTVFTLFPDLTIHSVYNGYWFWGRPSSEELRRDLRAITREIRSDWDVSSGR
jgi:peroxiredoxin